MMTAYGCMKITENCKGINKLYLIKTKQVWYPDKMREEETELSTKKVHHTY